MLGSDLFMGQWFRATVVAGLIAGFLPCIPRVEAQQPTGISVAKPIQRPGVTIPGVVRALSELAKQAVYPVEGSPDWSVMAKDTVWVSSARVNHLVQLLPATGTVGMVVTIERPCSGLAYGYDSIWVPSCGGHVLARMDERTGTVTAVIALDPANSEGGITVGDGSIWIVAKPGRLMRIDPTTNKIVGIVALPLGAENPVFGGGFIWVSSSERDELLKVDPKTMAIAGRIAVGPTPRFLTVGAGSVWTLNQGDGSITRVEMATGKVLATIACGIPGEGGEITFGAGSVWAAMFDFPLTQVDAATNVPVRQWKGQGGDGVRYGFGSVWLSNLHQASVWQLSPAQK